MELIGNRVVIRPLERRDLTHVFKWWNDPEVMYYADDDPEPHSTMKDIEDRYNRETGEWADSTARYLIQTTSGQPIGHVMYRGLRSDTRSVWTGITIGERDYWGNGYGTEAIRLFLQFLFEEMHLHKVSITVSDFNARAIRAYEKCGFRHDGVLRHNAVVHGKFVDHFVMSILEDEFSSHPS